jgi:hypothetical protein
VSVADVEDRRAKRKADLEKARDAQYEIDLEALDELEIEYGDTNVKALSVPYSPGMPLLAVCRCPKPAEIKRFRARVKTKKGVPGDQIAAAEELAGVCKIYPDSEAYALMCDARPALHAQLGVAAVDLAVGSEEDEAKS